VFFQRANGDTEKLLETKRYLFGPPRTDGVRLAIPFGVDATSGIASFDLATGSNAPVIQAMEGFPVISRDLVRFVYTSNGLYAGTISGGSATKRLVGFASAGGVFWLDEGHVAVGVNLSGPPILYSVPITGGDAVLMTLLPTQSYAWSAATGRLAYITVDGLFL
jgi:hypothetical protein